MYEALQKRVWWGYLHEDLQELIYESILLLDASKDWDGKFHDYAFIVFPAAKAYEGFLKRLFLDMGFISREDYSGKRFRIGKALNPSLEPRLRFESVYDRVVDVTGNKELADTLWETWSKSRNLLFHWFPEEKNAITYEEAESNLNMIIETMDMAYKECKMETRSTL